MTKYIKIDQVPIFGPEGALNWEMGPNETLYNALEDYAWQEAVNADLLDPRDIDYTITICCDTKDFKMYLVKEDRNDGNGK